MPRINLIIVEGVIIILLVLFAGFLAYQNQALTRRIQELSIPVPTPTPIATETPADTETPASTPISTKEPEGSPVSTSNPSPINTFAP